MEREMNQGQSGFQELLDAIRAGKFSPSQMEDMTYAMHSAYVDHFPGINSQIPVELEDVADTMVMARKNTEPLEFGDDPEDTPRKLGYVHTVANVDGVSLERPL